MNLLARLLSFILSRPSKGGNLAFALLLLIAWPELLDGKGIIFGDIDLSLSLEKYHERIIGTWNENWSNPNFFNLTRLPFASFFYFFTHILGLPWGLIQGLFIFVLLWASGAFMGQLCRTTITKNLPNLPPWAVSIAAFASGMAYMLSPWAIVRVQHVYLLVGYALLPLGAYFLFRFFHIDSNHKQQTRSILLLAIIWALAASAVHYVFFFGFFIGGYFIYQLVLLLKKQLAKKATTISLFGGLLLLLLVLLVGFGVLPQVLGARVASIEPNNVNTLDSLALFSRFSSLYLAFLQASYWWPMLDVSSLPSAFFTSAYGLFVFLFFGVFLGIKSPFGRYTIGWGALFFILSLGSKGFGKGFLVWLVYTGPLASSLGFLFRDPNKLTALFGFAFALLFGLGLGLVLQKINQSELNQKIEHFARKIMDLPSKTSQRLLHITKWGYILVIWGAFGTIYAWVSPVWIHYTQNLYAKTAIPKEYSWYLQESAKNDEKQILLPRKEAIRSPGYGFANTHWNKGRPTSGIGVFSGIGNTYNATEGAHGNVSHVLHWLSDALSNQKTNKAKELLSLLGINTIWTMNDVLGHEEKTQQINENLQKAGLREEKAGFTRKFSQQKQEKTAKKDRSVFLFGGYDELLELTDLPDYQKHNAAHYFWDNTDNEPAIQQGDLMTNRFGMDLQMGNLGEFIHYPFGQINSANGFTGWGKTKLSNADWQWHKSQAGLKSFSAGMNAQKGIVFTHSPAALNLSPFDDAKAKGKLYMSTKDLSGAEEDFWQSKNPEKLEVAFRPEQINEKTPILSGTITQGNQKYWQVATSKAIKATEKTGYSFDLRISGQDVNKLHGKVVFLDDTGQEIGVDYVSAPVNTTTPDFLAYTGTFITPIGTHAMRLQLWAHRPPASKTYWWVHGLEIYDLGNITTKNELKLKQKVAKTGKYRVVMRTLLSPAGGMLTLSLPDGKKTKKLEINTKTETTEAWVWLDLGNVELRRTFFEMNIENKEGFNAIAAIGLIPEDAWEKSKAKKEAIAAKTRHMQMLNAERDTEWIGNLQSRKTESDKTGGAALRLKNGSLAARIETKNAHYGIWAKIPATPNGNWDFVVQTKGKELGNWTKSTQKEEKNKKRETYEKIGIVNAPKGEITIYAKANYTGKSLMETKDIHAFRYEHEWSESKAYQDTLTHRERNAECCDCVDLGDNYLDVNYKKEEDEAQMEIVPGCSCWWVISASNVAKIQEGDEYWLNLDMRAAFASKNHLKMIYLDEEKTYMSSYRIENTPEADSYDWQNVERLLKVPDGAKYAQLQIWSRENRFSDSRIAIKNLAFHRLYDFPTMDNLVLIEEDKNDEKIQDLWQIEEKVERERSNDVFTTNESYNPLWQTKNGQNKNEMGMKNSYLVPKGELPTPVFYPEKIYWGLLWVSGGSFFVLLMVLVFLRTKKHTQALHHTTFMRIEGEKDKK